MHAVPFGGPVCLRLPLLLMPHSAPPHRCGIAFVWLSLVWASATAQTRPALEATQELQAIRARAEHTADDARRLDRIEAALPADAPYPLRRELMRARIAVLDDTAGQEQMLAEMARLRQAAQAARDADTVNLMDIDRIFMTHEDAAIDTSLAQMHEVRARVTAGASIEVREALARSYGNLYFDAGNFDSALRHQLEALDLEQRLPRHPLVAQMYRLGTIGELYNAMNLPEQALEYVGRAQALSSDTMPATNRLQLLGVRAMALKQLGRMEEAGAALGEATRLAETDGSDFDRVRMNAFLAELLLAQGRSAQALPVVDRIAAFAEQKNSAYYRIKARLFRGQALIDLGQAESGVAMMSQANADFSAKGQMVDLLDGLNRQVAALGQERLFEQALAVAQQRQQLRARLFRSEHARAVAELGAAREAMELEHRIDTLSVENRTQDASLRNERLAKGLALAVAVLAAGVSVLLYLLIRRTRGERDRLSHAVRHDPLTGAMSRYQFQQQADRARPAAARTTTALLLLDIDHFKSINDRFGHAAGDAVLQALVQRIQRTLAGQDELYRWGGEEFLLVLRGPDRAAVQATMARLVEAIESEPVAWADTALPVSVSGGAVFHPLAPHWTTPLSDAVRWADAALYQAKGDGRRRIEQVELTEAGKARLHGHRPIDLTQLLDWKRQGLLRIRTLELAPASEVVTGLAAGRQAK